MAIAYYLSFDGSLSNADVHQGVSLTNVSPLPQMGTNERGKRLSKWKRRQRQALQRHGRMSLWSSIVILAPNLMRQGSLWVC